MSEQQNPAATAESYRTIAYSLFVLVVMILILLYNINVLLSFIGLSIEVPDEIRGIILICALIISLVSLFFEIKYRREVKQAEKAVDK